MDTGPRTTTGRAKVYRFRVYDIGSEEFKISGRMATAACIRRIHAQAIGQTELDVDGMH